MADNSRSDKHNLDNDIPHQDSGIREQKKRGEEANKGEVRFLLFGSSMGNGNDGMDGDSVHAHGLGSRNVCSNVSNKEQM